MQASDRIPLQAVGCTQRGSGRLKQILIQEGYRCEEGDGSQLQCRKNRRMVRYESLQLLPPPMSTPALFINPAMIETTFV